MSAGGGWQDGGDAQSRDDGRARDNGGPGRGNDRGGGGRNGDRLDEVGRCTDRSGGLVDSLIDGLPDGLLDVLNVGNGDGAGGGSHCQKGREADNVEAHIG